MAYNECYPRANIDVKATLLRRQSAEVFSTAVGNSMVDIVTDKLHLLTYNSTGAWYTVYAMLLQINLYFSIKTINVYVMQAFYKLWNDF